MTNKQKLYIDTWINDFFGELNYMAGCAAYRGADRIALLGNVARFQASIPRNPHEHMPAAPYSGVLLQERIAEAAEEAIKCYGADVESLSDDSIRRLAIGGVDRVMEYMTSLDEEGKPKKWRTESFLIGLTQGNAQRWGTAQPERHLNETLSNAQTPRTIENFYARYDLIDFLSKKNDRERSATQSSGDEVAVTISFDDDDGYAEKAAREKSQALHHMIARFEADCQTYLFEQSPVLLANLVQNPLNADENPIEDSQSTERDLLLGDMSTNISTHSISRLNQPWDNEAHIIAMKARFHRMLLRKPLPQDSAVKRFFNIQSWQTPVVAVDSDVATPHRQSFSEGLNEFISPPASWFSRIFLKKPVQQWLIQGEQGSFKPLVFDRILFDLKGQSQTPPWVPVLIDFSSIDLSLFDSEQPFLPQYFQKILGYTQEGVLQLKTNYRFILVFNELDTCPSELMQRIYFGEETADWPMAKVIFTAPFSWVPPVRPNAKPVKQSAINPLNVVQIKDTLDGPWLRSLSENTREDINLEYNQFLAEHSELLDLIRPFSEQEIIPVIDERASEAAQMRQAATLSLASPMLLNLLMEIIPILRETSPETWPTNRHELYGIWLQHHIGDTHNLNYLKLKQIAINAFLQKKSFIKETIRANKAHMLLTDQSFLSVNIGQSRTETTVRYAFTQSGWQDYLVARTLWESLQDEGDLNLPELHLWNSVNWQKEYPGVLHFLVEFLNASHNQAQEVDFLRKRWVSNGELICWENAYHNVNALLKRVDCQLQSPVAPQAFLYLNTTREMHVIEELDEAESALKKCVFDSLGHGTGISGASTQYTEDFDTPRNRRYIRANATDVVIGNQLVQRAYKAIDDADKTLLEIMAPDYWGLYSRETQWKISDCEYQISINHAAIEYIKALQLAVLSPERALLIAIKNFRAATKSHFIAKEVKLYKERIEKKGYWFNRRGDFVPVSDKHLLSAHLIQYQADLDAHIEQFTLEAKASLRPTVQSTEEGESLLPALTTVERLTKYCEIRQEAITKDSEQLNQNIDESRHLNKGLITGTEKRFEMLMKLYPETRQIYADDYAADEETVTASILSTIGIDSDTSSEQSESKEEKSSSHQKAALKHEIRKGELTQVINRFRTPFIHARYAEFIATVNGDVSQVRSDYLFSHLNGSVPKGLEEHKTAWRKLKAEWSSKDDRKEFKKDTLIRATKKGYAEEAKRAMIELFTPSTRAIFEGYLNQLIDESVRLDLLMTIQHIMDHNVASLSAWQSMSSDEKARFCQQIVFSVTSDKANAPTIESVMAEHKLLFPAPTDEYLKRYLRFGLVVDACTAELHETLCVYALGKLGDALSSSYGKKTAKTEALFDIIQYLFNAGASLYAESNSNLKLPMDYVNRQRLQNYEHPYWLSIHNAMKLVSHFQQNNIDVEKILIKMVNDIIDFIQQYKLDFNGEGYNNMIRSFIAYLSNTFRSDVLKTHRETVIAELPSRVEKIRHNLFNLPKELETLEQEALKFPTRVRQGRLATNIITSIQRCKKDLGLNPELYALMVIHSEKDEQIDPYNGEYRKTMYSMFFDSRQTKETKAAIDKAKIREYETKRAEKILEQKLKEKEEESKKLKEELAVKDDANKKLKEELVVKDVVIIQKDAELTETKRELTDTKATVAKKLAQKRAEALDDSVFADTNRKHATTKSPVSFGHQRDILLSSVRAINPLINQPVNEGQARGKDSESKVDVSDEKGYNLVRSGSF